MEDEIKRLKNQVENKETEKIQLIDKGAKIHIETEAKLSAYDESLKNLELMYEAKLSERQNLEVIIKQRNDQFNAIVLKKKESMSQVAILELEVDMAKQNYELKESKRDEIKNHLEELQALAESLAASKKGLLDDDLRHSLADELMKKSTLILHGAGKDDDKIDDDKFSKNSNGLSSVYTEQTEMTQELTKRL